MDSPGTHLNDRCGRRIDYLRVSVTDRCDLRCAYCMPRGYRAFKAPGSWLTFDEIERVVRAFAALGVSRVRLTGGEPLLRPRLAELAARLGAVPGIADLSLSTNATLLADHAGALKAAGVRRLNVSLDTVRPDRFARIAGRDALDRVLAGLERARALGFAPIKINMVPLAGVNDDEVDDMLDYCAARGFVLRLIEVMPFGDAACALVGADLVTLRERLQVRHGLVDGVLPGGGPARYLVSRDGRFNVGFITPVSQHFCAGCNRVRLAVDGTLYPCVGDQARVSLADVLRQSGSETRLREALREAVALKPERHDFSTPAIRVARVMAATGG